MRYTHGGVARNTLDDFWAKVDVAGEDSKARQEITVQEWEGMWRKQS